MPLTPEQLDNYADVLCWAVAVSRKAPLDAGDPVVLRFDPPALALAESVHSRLLDLGANPVVRMNPTSRMESDLFRQSSFGQLVYVPAGERELMDTACGVITLLAPQELTHLAEVNPDDISVLQQSRRPLRDIMMAREEAGLLGWTLGILPTPVLAAAAGLELEDYTARLARACRLNLGEPRKEWQRALREIREVTEWLNALAIREVHVESAGVDLTVGLGEQRRFIGLTGHNIPSFEVYTSPDWRTVHGLFTANLPSYRAGQQVDSVRLRFEHGRLAEVWAPRALDFVLRQLSLDPGASRVGEFSLTDKRLSRIDAFMAHVMLDENHGGEHGNCHIAMGGSYADTFAGERGALTPESKRELGFNTSGMHWDLVNIEDKRVTAKLGDGSSRVIYESGMFTL